MTAIKGYLNIVKKLLDKGADINARNNGGLTPLELANNEGKSEVVNFLISYKDKHGSTPLHYSAKDNNSDLVGLLLDKGANINVKNNGDLTPLELAKEYNKLEEVSFLRKKQQERPVQRKRRHHHACHHSGKQKYLQRKEHSIHLELEGTDHSVENGNSAIENDQAISGASNPSSWINGLFGWIKSSIGGGFRAALPETSAVIV